MNKRMILWLLVLLGHLAIGCGNDDNSSGTDVDTDTDTDTDTDSDTDVDTDTDSDSDPDSMCSDGTLEYDGVLREYIICVPESYTGDEPVPLVFHFHGYTQQNSVFMNLADLRPNAETSGFILVYPQGTVFEGSTHWNVGGNWTEGSTVDDLGFTEAMIDSFSSKYNIDLARVYATGYSNGGYMSFLLACQLSDRIAAIAGVAGVMIPSMLKECDPKHPTPIMQIHGTEDLSVSYTGDTWTESVDAVLGYWTEWNNCNPKATAAVLPDASPNDGSTVEYVIFDECDNGVTVEHFKVLGGEHDWPGSWGNMDIDASDEIWGFFSKYNIDGLMK